jgi:uncharacterized protein YgbK (DUF1537 family)
MIAVIADDFTGAAEIGGVGLRYGLKVVILTSVQEQPEADLLVITTNSRSLSPDEASAETERISRLVMDFKPDFIYKKLDSVLRGNITREIMAHLSVFGKKRAILVPGNPDLGRTIEKGFYYVNGIPLDRTFFAQSPDFPVNSASVVDIISKKGIPAVSRSIDEDLPGSGIIVGDVTSQYDLARWAQKIDENTLAAGGAGFFDVIMSGFFRKQKEIGRELFYLDGISLFVLGSRYPKDEKMLGKINGNDLVRLNMPEAIYRDRNFAPALLDRWAEEIIRSLNKGERVVVSVDHETHDEPGLTRRIRTTLGKLVQRVSSRVKIDNLLIEGGATTHEILHNLGIIKLYPIHELELGIIRMRADNYPGLCIITKPGSYKWPDHVEFKNRETGT